ncbi:hypothetical protein EXN22_17795 [Pseudomonas tructae]|uniref:Uncharacterized protein n=1 Tax=Pseudomonas tructae TaxID=2518644 RepID=A0A411MKW8_9PSED|nr:hypothetical protein [Pseudomonas tructae]QBF27445.1 hypothetical protein EXN22_17795 [Pseudomonas tructae]
MIGVIVNFRIEELDAVRLDWGFTFAEPVNNVDVHRFCYFVAKIGNKPKFLAKVSSISVTPGKKAASWRVSFGAIYEVDSFQMDLGGGSDRVILINPANEGELEEIVRDRCAITRPDELPVYLTIEEAEQALHVRYGISKSKIKISLHN